MQRCQSGIDPRRRLVIVIAAVFFHKEAMTARAARPVFRRAVRPTSPYRQQPLAELPQRRRRPLRANFQSHTVAKATRSSAWRSTFPVTAAGSWNLSGQPEALKTPEVLVPGRC